MLDYSEQILGPFKKITFLCHATGFHETWVVDLKSFPLPANQLFWSKSGKTPPEGWGGGSVTPTTATISTTATSVASSSHVGPLSTFFLSSSSRKHSRWKRGRLYAHDLFSFARLSKFGQDLGSVRWPYVSLSKPTVNGFCDWHKTFLKLQRLLSTFSTVDHVKNTQSCVNHVHTLRGTFGGSHDNRGLHSIDPLDPKNLTLIWNMGAYYGLPLFWSDFIVYWLCQVCNSC